MQEGKKIVVPIGYMGSGSSAVTNLLAEYDGINVKFSEYEFCFIHAPNGLLDLEDRLFCNNNFVRSDEAIKTFREEMTFFYKPQFYWAGNYKKIFGPHFMELTEDFISRIKQADFEGYWYYHERPRFCSNLLKGITKVLRKLSGRRFPLYTIRNYQGMEWSMIDRDSFYAAARDYLSAVLGLLSRDRVTVWDQLLLPHNLYRVGPYFSDRLCPIVVERDPRDVFVLNKYVWKRMNNPVPYPMDAEQFCAIYKHGREAEQPAAMPVLRLWFEDLILHYDESVKRIEAFLELEAEKHTAAGRYLDPSKSIKNIGVFRQFPEAAAEVAVIERELSAYLYPDMPQREAVKSVRELF